MAILCALCHEGVKQRTTEDRWDGVIGPWMDGCHVVHHIILIRVGGSQKKLPMNTLRLEE